MGVTFCHFTVHFSSGTKWKQYFITINHCYHIASTVGVSCSLQQHYIRENKAFLDVVNILPECCTCQSIYKDLQVQSIYFKSGENGPPLENYSLWCFEISLYFSVFVLTSCTKLTNQRAYQSACMAVLHLVILMCTFSAYIPSSWPPACSYPPPPHHICLFQHMPLGSPLLFITHNASWHLKTPNCLTLPSFAELSDVWSISSVNVRPDLRSMPSSPSTPHLPTITEEWLWGLGGGQRAEKESETR